MSQSSLGSCDSLLIIKITYTGRTLKTLPVFDERFILISTIKMIMDIFDVIKGRRSVRSFTEKPVPEDLLRKVLESFTYAPSAGNIQPWEIILVKEEGIKRKLAEAALRQYFIARAPVVVVVCANQRMSERVYGYRGSTLYCIQDAAAAIQNMLLAAYASGLGTCWVGAFNEELVREILKIPYGVRPVAIIPIGWPAERPSKPRKKALKSILHYEKY